MRAFEIDLEPSSVTHSALPSHCFAGYLRQHRHQHHRRHFPARHNHHHHHHNHLILINIMLVQKIPFIVMALGPNFYCMWTPKPFKMGNCESQQRNTLHQAWCLSTLGSFIVLQRAPQPHIFNIHRWGGVSCWWWWWWWCWWLWWWLRWRYWQWWWWKWWR